MEALCAVDFRYRSGGRTLWMADPRRRRNLQSDDSEAAAVAAQHSVSNRMDSPLCANGRWGRPNLSGARFAGSLPEPAAFLASVGLQFFLKHLVFQFAAFRLCPCVAGRALGADCMDDVDLPQDGPVGRKAANTLSYWGRFCGLFESGSLALESIAPWI